MKPSVLCRRVGGEFRLLIANPLPAEVEEAEAQLRQVEQTIAESQKELEALDAGRAVYEFVRERSAEGGTYRAEEGMISTVRRDLEALSGLIRDWKIDSKEAAEAAKTRPGDGASVEQDGLDLPTPDVIQLNDLESDERRKLPIQRIVLYIDDLDRCPQDRVVDVLQAVHLLLAFDLFVVVVGVDPRWLERSLKGTYRRLIDDRSTSQSGFHHQSATAQDYLEKIFQIPFTLPSVQTDGFSELLAKNLRTKKELAAEQQKEAESTSPESSLAPSPKSEQTTQTNGDQPKHPEAEANNAEPPETALPQEPPLPDEPTTSTDGSLMAFHDTENDNLNTTDVHETEPPDSSATSSRPPLDSPTESDGVSGNDVSGGGGKQGYHIEPWERRFLDRMHVFLDTPRVIKRYVNIYRLIRVGVKPQAFNAFVGQPDQHDAEHRVTAILLALDTGYAPEYRDLRERLHERLMERIESAKK